MSDMTEEEQQKAIQEICGWREAFPESGTNHPETRKGGILLTYYWVNEITHKRAMEPPNYLYSLDAMHEAEEMFHKSFESSTMYLCELERIVYKTKHSGIGIGFAILNATAAQRAKAFLKTVTKWTE